MQNISENNEANEEKDRNTLINTRNDVCSGEVISDLADFNSLLFNTEAARLGFQGCREQ